MKLEHIVNFFLAYSILMFELSKTIHGEKNAIETTENLDEE